MVGILKVIIRYHEFRKLLEYSHKWKHNCLANKSSK